VTNMIVTVSDTSTLRAANTRRLLTDVIRRYPGHLLLCATLQYAALEAVDKNLIATSILDFRSADTLDYCLLHYCLCLTDYHLRLIMKKMRVEMSDV
jgi:hypothetical protein